MKKNATLKYGILFVLFVVAIFVLPGLFRKESKSNIAHAETLTIYKDPNCGCCGNYAAYMKKEGYDVNVVSTQDMDAIKEKYHIPSDLLSCHTTVVGDGTYVVEGHVPAEAVKKMLDEKPPIKGIGMGGMPSGSPGMPGAKQGAFMIQGIDSNGRTVPFVQL